MELAFLLDHCECASHFFFPVLCTAAQKSSNPKNAPTAHLRIPETVLYTYSKPTAWYSFDEQLGGVRRRAKKHLNSSSILEAFILQGNSRTGIKAWYAYPTEDLSTISKGHHHHHHGGSGALTASGSPKNSAAAHNNSHHHHGGGKGRGLATVGFIKEADLTAQLHVPEVPLRITSQAKTGKDGLLRFLQLPKGKGMLQLYIDNQPESDGSMHNVVAVCTYSHVTFTVERLASRHKLSDGSIPLENRFDLQSNVYDRRPVMTPASARQFLNACESAAKCITFALGYDVAFISLCCRLDNKDQLHVLWCNSLKLHQISIHPGLLFHVNHFGTQAAPYGEEAIRQQQQVEYDPDEEDGGYDGQNNSASQSLSSTRRSRGSASALALTRRRQSNKAAALSCVAECRVCHTEQQRGLMPRVQLKWLLFALSLLDSRVEGWGEDIPPSVAMVCPEMTAAEFHRVKHDEAWKGEFIRVCDECLLRANEANEKLCKNQQLVPDWLHIDVGCRRGAAGSAFRAGGGVKNGQQHQKSLTGDASGATQQNRSLTGPSTLHNNSSSHQNHQQQQLSVKSTDITTTGMERHVHYANSNQHGAHHPPHRGPQHHPLRKSDVLSTLFGIRRDKTLRQADDDDGPRLLTGSGNVSSIATLGEDDDDDDASTRRRRLQRPRVAPRFAAAAKDHVLAAPLFATDARGVWRQVGFGRPASPPRDLAPVPLSLDSRRLLVRVLPPTPELEEEPRDDNDSSDAPDDDKTEPASSEPPAADPAPHDDAPSSSTTTTTTTAPAEDIVDPLHPVAADGADETLVLDFEMLEQLAQLNDVDRLNQLPSRTRQFHYPDEEDDDDGDDGFAPPSTTPFEHSTSA